MTKPKLWHSYSARSLRPLWALEEMELDYELELLPFPPRVFKREYLELNALGTVPFFTHGDTEMTESSGICLYLVETFKQLDFGLPVGHAEYGDYLNWLFHSDATLTFPQTIALRYSQLEPKDRRLPQAVEDYSTWFIKRLKRLNAHLEGREYLCDGRFTIADIAIGYALYLGESLGLDQFYEPIVVDYWQRLKSRPAFIKAEAMGSEQALFKAVKYPFTDAPELF
ncbi:glutathione S-transferase [Litorivivens lipolytica]|uniref:Glutathione S-transferase n=1 Tax=Litorivivens lipolytica TaxID=1524264 RepID=A0A7W4Z7E9_9GAMM|nr:glutathione S-transferase family protein [Litorivivens lipolytica]MBB3047851.1 glutathione S-transferase [Litorivivens lipolytica]